MQLTVTGGPDRYDWELVGGPGELSFSTETQTLSGRATAPGSMVLRLTDKTTGEAHDTRFDWTPRRSCWLAYTSNETGSSRLQLVDPVLEGAPGIPRSTRLSLPESLLDTEAVASFVFSPDGRWLAARVASSDGGQRLELYEAPDWRRVPLELPGSVKYQAWSPDGRVLAVAYDEQGTTLLGGLLMSSMAPSPAGDSSATSAASLIPLAAPVDSELVWLGSGHVVFHSPAIDLPPEERRLHHAALELDVEGSARFADHVTDPGATYPLTSDSFFRIEPATDGFFAIFRAEGFDTLLNYYTLRGAGEPLQMVRHRSDAVPSPTRHHAAAVPVPDDLLVYRSDETVRDPENVYPLPMSSAAGSCGRLLAWSRAGDRIACATDEDGGGVINLFTFDENAPDLRPRAVEGQYDYGANAAFERRRTFSPGGTWFAFATGDRVFLADLSGERPIVERPGQYLGVQEPGQTPDLSFSPDDTKLLVHDADRLLLLGLTPPAPVVALNTAPLSLPEPCLEVEGATALSWCGSQAPHSSDVHWSPSSQVVAYRTSTGELRVLRLPIRDELSLTTGCGAGCSLSFAFQP